MMKRIASGSKHLFPKDSLITMVGIHRADT